MNQPAPRGFGDLVAEAKSRISEITVEEAATRQRNGAILIDVREPNEVAAGLASGATAIARGLLEGAVGNAVDGREREILVYCAGGARSALAADSLGAMGYTNVYSIEGGFAAWKNAELPWELPAGLDNDQEARYQRHLSLPEIGHAGQEKLLASTVLVVGAGGLGSPALLYLAAAGVGTIAIVDNDRVEGSNLQRQIIHNADRIGSEKVESARRTLEALNSDVTVLTHAERLTASNVLKIAADADVIIDGADNFPTRYLINDASVHLHTPVVHGSIFRFEGQVSVFDPPGGPCYRCLFPEAPPPELAPNCAEAGVLGVLPGVIGALQATEAIKLLLGIGTSLSGTLLTYDALDQRFMHLGVEKRSDCIACGDPDHLPAIVDYNERCVSGS